jgi:uncharacterized UPF0146 family protein
MKIATLGPAGSNHDLNTRRYIEFHGIKNASIVYIESFLEAIDRMHRGEIDLTIQVCAHPDVAPTIEHHHADVFLVDCFIGKTKAMGVITRADVDKPKSIGYMVATAGYFRPEEWQDRTLTLSNADTAARILKGEFDSGFTALEVAEQHPGRFRIDKTIGEVDVVWLVYGRQRTNTGKLLAWKESPMAELLR